MKAGTFVSILVAGILAMPVAMAAEKAEKAAKEGKGDRIRKTERVEKVQGDAISSKDILGKGFAGMIRGTVTAKADGNLIVEVTKILRTWKHSKLESAESLVGQKVTVLPAKKSPNVGRYAEKLTVGDVDEFDVRQDGKFMVWLELSGPQREKIGAAK